MLQKLSTGELVVGAKQTRRAIQNGLAKQILIASDADPLLTEPIAAQCREQHIPAVYCPTMGELGEAAGIQVGASVVTILK